ncbi:MAG: class I SAM-dependent methyltransferase [Candidatus Calescibacterium sp.]
MKMINNDKCLICNAKCHKTDFQTPGCVTSDGKFINSPLSHSYCSNCGYVFVDFDKRIDNYEKFYKTEYEFLLEGEVEPVLDDKKYSDILLEFFQDFLENSPRKTFFDIGAGKGNFIQAVHDKFEKLQKYAIEPGKSFEILKTKTFLKKVYNDFFRSENFNIKFDYISLVGVLEHVQNPKEFLLDIKNIMHKDSYLLIEVPNFENNKSDLLTIDHLSKFTEKSILNLFKVCGLEVIKQRVSNSIPMQFILKRVNSEDCEINSTGVVNPLNETEIESYINNAVKYLKKVEKDVSKVENDKIIVYGQGLILHYLLGINKIKIENIVCVIDDNPFYWGKKFKNQVKILSFDDFMQSALYKQTNKIFLAMNDCYHRKVINKLKSTDELKNLQIIGANI